MNRLLTQLAIVLLLTSVAVASAPAAGTAGQGRPAQTRLAGPWHTSQELKALIAYSKASLAQKKAILSESTAAPGTASKGSVPLAGPWYTPGELKALIAYSKASLAQKKAILAGNASTRLGARAHIPSNYAGIAAVALSAVLLAGGIAVRLARTRA